MNTKNLVLIALISFCHVIESADKKFFASANAREVISIQRMDPIGPKQKCMCGSKKQYQRCCGKLLFTKKQQSNAATTEAAGKKS